jgi:hypothetical protein
MKRVTFIHEFATMIEYTHGTQGSAEFSLEVEGTMGLQQSENRKQQLVSTQLKLDNLISASQHVG